MKFEKGEFEIRLDNLNYETVRGLKCVLFGVHKNGQQNYNVTHLPTGFKIMSFVKQSQAKKFITYLLSEKFPVSWYSGSKNMNFSETTMLFYPNGKKVFELTEKVKTEIF